MHFNVLYFCSFPILTCLVCIILMTPSCKTFKLNYFLSHSVNLHLANEQTCSGDDLTFYCNATETGLLVWNLVNLPGITGATTDRFGMNLNRDIDRITSPDLSLGPNPSIIAILGVTSADNGAIVQCSIINGASSEVITLSIRE